MNEQVNNYVLLVGTIHKEPIHKLCKNNSKMITFCIKIDEHSKFGKTFSQYYMILLFGELAYNNQTLCAGDTVKVEGKLKNSSYQKDGAWINSTSINATTITVLSKAQVQPQYNQPQYNQPQQPPAHGYPYPQQQSQPQQQTMQVQNNVPPDYYDDIPF